MGIACFGLPSNDTTTGRKFRIPLGYPCYTCAELPHPPGEVAPNVWRRRFCERALKTVGLGHLRPLDLRHAAGALWIAADRASQRSRSARGTHVGQLSPSTATATCFRAPRAPSATRSMRSLNAAATTPRMLPSRAIVRDRGRFLRARSRAQHRTTKRAPTKRNSVTRENSVDLMGRLSTLPEEWSNLLLTREDTMLAHPRGRGRRAQNDPSHLGKSVYFGEKGRLFQTRSSAGSLAERSMS